MNFNRHTQILPKKTYLTAVSFFQIIHCRYPLVLFFVVYITPLENVRNIHPQKLTWNLEMMVSNRNLLFQGSIFRFHVCFGGCTTNQGFDLVFPYHPMSSCVACIRPMSLVSRFPNFSDFNGSPGAFRQRFECADLQAFENLGLFLSHRFSGGRNNPKRKLIFQSH